MSGASRSRCFSESFLESASPAMGLLASRITAAALTGPAKGPRPASSTPQIRICIPVTTPPSLPLSGEEYTRQIWQDGRGSFLRGVLTQCLVQCGERLFEPRHGILVIDQIEQRLGEVLRRDRKSVV